MIDIMISNANSPDYTVTQHDISVKSITGTVSVEYRWHHQYETEQAKWIPEVCYRAIKGRGKKICARRLLLQKQNSNTYLKSKIGYAIKEKEANLQNINNILWDLSWCIYIYIYNDVIE
jgi:hypothetical protein